MMSENGMGTIHHIHMSGYIRRPASIPGQYERKVASKVSSNKPAIRTLFLGKENEVQVLLLSVVAQSNVGTLAAFCENSGFRGVENFGNGSWFI